MTTFSKALLSDSNKDNHLENELIIIIIILGNMIWNQQLNE